LNFIAPSWDDIFSKSVKLAKKIRKEEKNPFECIVGISRGGLVLTRIMSDLLDIQNFSIVRCEYYSDIGKKRKKPVITQIIQDNISGKKVLLIDDVADSGESLIVIKKYLLSKLPNELKISTIFVKPWCKMIPDYYVAKTHAWIIFPWEYYETIKSLSATNDGNKLAKTKIPLKYVDTLYEMDRSLQVRRKKIAN
jgi:uncharacterized protein